MGVMDRGGVVWRVRLRSAFRTAIACTIVGCTALYGPEPITQQIRYPSVSYVTAVLIVSDATLGSAVMGCFHALCATVLVVPPSVLCLWAVGPYRFSEVGAAVAVAVSAFFVAVPEFLPLLTKRIAFGELVIIYVGAVVHSRETGSLMHPTHVAASSALGAVASVLALLLPYPWLASTEVKRLFQSYTENASQRANLYMKAFLSEDTATAGDFVSQAKPMAHSGSKLLHQINHIQRGLTWERFRIRRGSMNMAHKSYTMETLINGMETALTSIPSFPLRIIDNDTKNVLHRKRVLEQSESLAPVDDAMTVPERKVEAFFDESLRSLVTVSSTTKDLPGFFFLSCIELLLTQKPDTSEESWSQTRKASPTDTGPRLRFAFKCSLALGFAVLLGLLFDKKNGYWSGLTIAISFAAGNQPTFAVASARVHGTAVGTVFGVLGSCLLHRVVELRFVILLPWIVFTSLLQHSRMYGQEGGVSAVLGALLILGRKNYGPANEFAIARLTEASIGLFCLIVSEIVFQPARAATLEKAQLSRCLGTLHECIHQLALCSSTQKENKASNFLSMAENKKILKSQIDELKKLTTDAKSEPNFWFLPFQATCYENLQETLWKTADLLQIMVYNIEFLHQRSDAACKELQEHVKGDLVVMKECISPFIKNLQKIASSKSLDSMESKQQERIGFKDLESGNPQPSRVSDEAITKVLDGFLRHSKEVTEKIQGEEDYKGKAILHLNSLGFCISSLMRETLQLEKGIKEMVRWENPSRNVNFHELCYKIDTVDP